MKSSEEDLRKRGKFSHNEIDLLSNLKDKELIELIDSNSAVIRTAAVHLLFQRGYIKDEDFTSLLLKRLTIEKCLYTKIEICETLEKGDSKTASQMVAYLGCIGDNQHATLPEKVSLKVSFPCARDIIARSLAKMDTSILPTLIDVLYNKNINQISEVLDAIGSMVFYHQDLVNLQLLEHIKTTMNTYRDNPIIQWKCVLCLSAFPISESQNILEHILITNCHQTIKKEAERSLKLIKLKLHSY